MKIQRIDASSEFNINLTHILATVRLACWGQLMTWLHFFWFDNDDTGDGDGDDDDSSDNDDDEGDHEDAFIGAQGRW